MAAPAATPRPGVAEPPPSAYYRRMPAWAPPLVAVVVLMAILALGAVAQRLFDEPESWDADFRRKLHRWDGLVPVWVQDEARRRREY